MEGFLLEISIPEGYARDFISHLSHYLPVKLDK